MAVTLEGAIKRFIGLSTDVKPLPGQRGDLADASAPALPAADLPAGSSFFETDTWRIARYDGAGWRYEETNDAMARKIDELLQAQRETNELLAMIAGKL